MSKKLEIHRILHEKFKPEILEVIDESYKHQGHSGYQEGEETHFKLTISADAIKGKTRLENHRDIHLALKEIMPKIHALQIILK
jgi:BolA protein